MVAICRSNLSEPNRFRNLFFGFHDLRFPKIFVVVVVVVVVVVIVFAVILFCNVGKSK